MASQPPLAYNPFTSTSFLRSKRALPDILRPSWELGWVSNSSTHTPPSRTGLSGHSSTVAPDCNTGHSPNGYSSNSMNAVAASPSPIYAEFKPTSVEGITTHDNQERELSGSDADTLPESRTPGDDPDKSTIRSWTQSLVLFVFVYLLLLSIPRLSAFKHYDEDPLERDPEDVERFDEDRVQSRRSVVLQRRLSFLFWFCTSLLLAVAGFMSTAHQVNDALVINAAVLAACLLLMAIGHISCLQHLAGVHKDLDHRKAAARGSRHTLQRYSVLFAAPFAWAAWASIVSLYLVVIAVLRLPIPLCEVDAEIQQALFPSCRSPLAPTQIFIYLELPYRITTAFIIVIGALHGAFNFYHLS